MEIFHGRYELQHLLGRGASSEVWRVKDIQTGVVMAMKIYAPSTGMDDNGIQMMTREFSLLVNVNNKNLLHPLFFDTCERKPFLLLPYCKNGNISKNIGKFSERDAWRLIRDVAGGLAYLHAMEPPVIHQDIKPDNILVSDDGTFMITDFGVSINARATASDADASEEETAGTLCYMAPECFSQGNRPIKANDIFSLGATVFEMLTGDVPFGYLGGKMLSDGADIPVLDGDYTDELKNTIVRCLQKDPWDRPTARQLTEQAELVLSNKTPTVMQFGNKVIGGDTHATSNDQTDDHAVPPDRPSEKDTVRGGVGDMSSSVVDNIDVPQEQPTTTTDKKPTKKNKISGTVVGDGSSSMASTNDDNSNYVVPEKKGFPTVPVAIAASVVVVALAAWLLWPSAKDNTQPISEVSVNDNVPTVTVNEPQAPDVTEETVNVEQSSSPEEPSVNNSSEGSSKNVTSASEPANNTTPISVHKVGGNGVATHPSGTGTSETARNESGNGSQKEKAGTSNAPTSASTTNSSSVSSSSGKSTINMGYGTWVGEVKNGKPNGEGTMTYTQAHRIDTRDPNAYEAQPGDKIEGEMIGGHWTICVWHKSDGTKKTLVIGD